VRQHIEERTVELGKYIVEKKCTVREAAKKFGISKSTVHKDITEKLPHINSALYKEVKKVLETNKKERHIRGGMATKHKYEMMQKKN
jgi:putative DeoR family transcriptional regulator (stage III sporulation protein D)